jgi:uncharacterized repeat protein (TIGR01451 family)
MQISLNGSAGIVRGYRFALVIVGLLWLGVLGGGAARAQVQVPAFVEVPGSPFLAAAGPHDVRFSPDGSLLASANSNDRSVSVFRVGAGGQLTPVQTIPTGGIEPSSLSFSPGGGLVAVVNILSHNVSVFRVGSGGQLTLVQMIATQGENPYWGAFSPDGQWFAVTNQNSHTVTVFRVVGGDEPFEFEATFPSHGSFPTGLAFSPDGRWLAVGHYQSNDVSVFDVGTNGHLSHVETVPTGAPDGSQSGWGVAYSPVGGLLATANANHHSVSVFTVNPNTGGLTPTSQSPLQMTGDFTNPQPPAPPGEGTAPNPRAVEFSPDGKLLATGNFNIPGTASVLAVGPGGALSEVTGSPFPAGPGAKHTAFNPDGDLFAVANFGDDDVSVFGVLPLEITKTAATTVAAGGVLSYTVTVRNPGDIETSGPVVDDLSGVLDRATLVGTPTTTAGTVTVDQAARTLTWNGSLAGGAEVTIHYRVRVRESARGLLYNGLSGRAGSTCAANGGPPGSKCVVETAIVPPRGQVDLSVSKTPSTATVHPGGQIVYTLTVRNHGPGAATGVTLEDPVPAGLFLQSARSSQGSCTVTPGERVRCRLGNLPAGGQALVLVTATVPLGATGVVVNTAAVFGDQGDPNPDNNVARARTRVVSRPQPVSDLRITKRVNHARARVGQRLTYTITVVNRKGGDAAANVRVTDASRLPLNVRSIRPSRGSCRAKAPFRCRLGTLRPGGRVTIRITVSARRAGRQINAAAVTTSSWQPESRIARAATRVLRRLPPPPVTG